MSKKVLTDSERLAAALFFVSESDVQGYADVCDYMEENNCSLDEALDSLNLY